MRDAPKANSSTYSYTSSQTLHPAYNCCSLVHSYKVTCPRTPHPHTFHQTSIHTCNPEFTNPTQGTPGTGFVLRNRFRVILYLLDHITGVLTPTLLGDLSSPDLVLPDYCRAGYRPICATNHTELFSGSHWFQRI